MAPPFGPPQTPGGYNKSVVYGVLLFYTVGVFAVGYLVGGSVFDPSEQQKFEAKHWEAQATKWISSQAFYTLRKFKPA